MTPRRKELIENAARNRQLDLAVILENVHDPHNISAVLRTCDSIGISEVYLLITDPVMQLKKKIWVGKRSSAGTRKWITVYRFHDADKCFKEVRKKHKRIFGTLLGESSESLYQLDLTNPTAFLFGNEHSGISNETAMLCDGMFHIPQFGFGESLNISVACGVTLYECARQRLQEDMYYRGLDNQKTMEAVDFLIDKFDSKKNGKLTIIKY